MQQANIVLADAQGTPVNHTFAANGVTHQQAGGDTNSRAEYVDRSATSAIGNWKILLDYKQRNSDGTFKLVAILMTPILENVSNSTISGIAPAPTVAYTPSVRLEATLPQRCTALDRQTARKMMYNLLANAQVVAFLETPERITG